MPPKIEIIIITLIIFVIVSLTVLTIFVVLKTKRKNKKTEDFSLKIITRPIGLLKSEEIYEDVTDLDDAETSVIFRNKSHNNIDRNTCNDYCYVDMMNYADLSHQKKLELANNAKIYENVLETKQMQTTDYEFYKTPLNNAPL